MNTILSILLNPILANFLFGLTFTCLVIWMIDQIFFVSHQKMQESEEVPEAMTVKQHFLILKVYQFLPYLMMMSIIRLIFMLRQGLDFDFNYILVPVTLFFFAIIIADKLYYKDRKKLGKGKERSLINNAYDFFPILAFVVVVRSFIIEPFNIPSSSMVPSLYTGDFILVNKFAYGVRTPLTHTKVIPIGKPQHGDVVVFRYPKNPKIYYIKRVIGLSGDKVSYANGVLSINDKPIDTQVSNYIASPELVKQLYTTGQPTDIGMLTANTASIKGFEEEQKAQYFQEKQGEHQHLARYLHDIESEKEMPNAQWRTIVPEGKYFVMGDNRDRSSDSRVWGFVPEANLAGKAVYIWMHKKAGLKNMPTFHRNSAID